MPKPKANRLQTLKDVGEKHNIGEYRELCNARWELFRAQLRYLYDKATSTGVLCSAGRVDWQEHSVQAQELKDELYADLDALKSEYNLDGYYEERTAALYPE